MNREADAAPVRALKEMMAAFIATADPSRCLPPHLPPPPKGQLIVLGAGKAAPAMARVVEQCWQGPLRGLVVTRYGHLAPCERIEVREARHPVPDAAGVAAANAVFALAGEAGPDDLVLCLLSGGGSALLPRPPAGITLADKQAVTEALLACGAPISALNCIRKHISTIKGGRLAIAAAPAPVVTLAISDVPGDDPGLIASGPTVPDPTPARLALEIVEHYRVALPPAVAAFLRSPDAETPKPGDRRFRHNRTVLIATPDKALQAAAEVGRQNGFTPVILGDALEGEARTMGREQAEIAATVLRQGNPAAAPAVILSGGEATVTVAGPGHGGPNTEFLTGLAMGLEEQGLNDGGPRIWALAVDSDGVDGQGDHAGAVIGPDTLPRARAVGLNPADYLLDNNTGAFFNRLGDLVKTGPTLTNINDFRAIVITGDQP